MNLTRAAFRSQSVTWLLAILLLGLGLTALFTLPRREDPDLAGRFGQIVVSWPGADVAQIETLVAEKVERTLREIDDVGNVTSTSRPGVAVVQFEAADRMTGSLATMMDDVRKRMDDLSPRLPVGAGNIAVNDRFSDTSALIVGVVAPKLSHAARESVAWRLRDALRILPDAGETALLGVVPQTVTIGVSSARLDSLGGAVTIASLSDALLSANPLPESGGSARAGNSRLSLTPSGLNTVETLARLDDLPIAAPNGPPVYLRDIATIGRGYADPAPSLLRIDGRAAVAVSVTLRKGKNIAALGAGAARVIESLKKDVPAGVTFTIVNDLPKSVARRIDGFFHELILAVVIIGAVMLLFMGPRAAALVGAMLPLSMLGTFAAMWASGRDIQQMSIAALIISLALVVDNSIVILDNIEEQFSASYNNGQTVDRAALAQRATESISGPLLTANLVAVTSFLPLAFLPGGVGDFVRDLGLVTSLSLGVSVLLNLTVLPLLCARFLRPGHEERKTGVQRALDRLVESLRDGKAGLAKRALARPGVVIALAALALLGSVSLIPTLGRAFFPPAERDQFTIDIWLPEGCDISATDSVVAKVEAILATQPKIRSRVAYIGEGGPRFYYNVSPEAPASNYAQIVVNTESLDATDALIPKVQAEADATIDGARITVKALEQGPPVGAPVAVRLRGAALPELRAAASELKRRLGTMRGVRSVSDSFGEIPLRLFIQADDDRAAAVGLSREQIARFTRLGFDGAVVGFLREPETLAGGRNPIPILLRLTPSERGSVGDLSGLYVARGVRLEDVATLTLAPSPARVVRRNGEPTLTVSAFTANRLPSSVVDELRAGLVRSPLPGGVIADFGGENEESGKSFVNMATVFSIAIVVNVVLLTLQFGRPAIVAAILSSVPLGVIGAVPGLFLAKQNFGFMAFLGIAALGGIVTNHTIFLFHYALEERSRGISMADALVDASRRRLRPILLTVLLSVGALLPQALSGSRLWPPLDWAIIAGLLVSTFLSMIVVPSVYAALDRKGMRAELAATDSVIFEPEVLHV